jgi:hypothetical protein
MSKTIWINADGYDMIIKQSKSSCVCKYYVKGVLIKHAEIQNSQELDTASITYIFSKTVLYTKKHDEKKKKPHKIKKYDNKYNNFHHVNTFYITSIAFILFVMNASIFGAILYPDVRLIMFIFILSMFITCTIIVQYLEHIISKNNN